MPWIATGSPPCVGSPSPAEMTRMKPSPISLTLSFCEYLKSTGIMRSVGKVDVECIRCEMLV